MSLVLSHFSALEMYRSPELLQHVPISHFQKVSHACQKIPLRNCCAPHVKEIELLHRIAPFIKSDSIDVVIDDEKKRRLIPPLKFHIDKQTTSVLPLTLGAHRLSNHKRNLGVFISTPEDLFVQLAQVLSFQNLLKLGYELCGSYSPSEVFQIDGIHPSENTQSNYAHPPFTNATRLRRNIHSAEFRQRKGIARARSAVQYILDGSASQRETAVALMLTLPHRLGGYGLPKPQLNYQVDIPKPAKRFFGKNYFVCDLYWPASKLAIEYDSDQFHTGSEKIAQDASRRDALIYLGIKVITITNQQFKQLNEMDQLARTIAKELGTRLRSDQRYDYLTRKRLLHKQLL